MRFYSPLRYPGGKAKLAPFIKSVFNENNLKSMRYVEPFAGGASVGLALLYEGYVSEITINDYDRSIYAFWHSVVNENERFCKKVNSIPIDIETWVKQKNYQQNKSKADLFSLGFSTFFLNRTNVSGIITGGIIGGKEQKGNYKIDARFNKPELISRIARIKNFKDKIEVTCVDALKLIQNDAKNIFYYLDPPYVKKSRNLYKNFFNQSDHEAIANHILSKKKSLWVLSYDRNNLISELYKKHQNKIGWDLSYGTSNKFGSEEIFLHRKLKFTESKQYLEN